MGNHNSQSLFPPHVPHFHRFCYRLLLSRTIIRMPSYSQQSAYPSSTLNDLSADTHRTDKCLLPCSVDIQFVKHTVWYLWMLCWMQQTLAAHVHITYRDTVSGREISKQSFSFQYHFLSCTKESLYDLQPSCPLGELAWVHRSWGGGCTLGLAKQLLQYKQWEPTPAFPSSCASLPVHTWLLCWWQW